MEHFAGIDASLKDSSVCVVDAAGRDVTLRMGEAAASLLAAMLAAGPAARGAAAGGAAA